MALSNVTINRRSSSSGRPLSGEDHYTGLIFFGTAPAITGKWKQYPGPPQIKAQQMFSDSDAISAGIIPYTENTAPTGTYLITTPGVAGDTFEIIVTHPAPKGTTVSVSLGVYTVPASGAATTALQAVAYTAMINSGTIVHGYSASVVGSTITITAPKSVGKSLNTGTPISTGISGAFVGTITQFSNGTVSNYAIWYYQIKEYFRIHPKGVLWVGIIAASSSFNEIKSLQVAGLSKIRQMGIYDNHATRGNAANVIGTILQINAAAITVQATAPLSMFYSPNIFSVADMSTYPDQNLNVAPKVQCVVSQDGDAEGATLFIHAGQSIGNIGVKLGTISKSRVSASDAQAQPDFNGSDGVENDTIAYANGQLVEDAGEGVQDQLDRYNYTFFRKFSTVAGSYWNDNKCCITRSSDFCNVNDNRTADKIARILYTTYVPLLNAEILFNADGTLQDYTIESFKDIGFDAIDNNMIKGFGSMPLITNPVIDIDPSQDVQHTDNFVVDPSYTQNGIARNITLNISKA